MIQFTRVTFTYPEAGQPALCEVSFSIPARAAALVVGPSGSGKSTLLKCLNGLAPHFTGGSLRGAIQVAGLDPALHGPQRMCQEVGFVFQDPEAQFVLDHVEDEIAFALENAAVERQEMRQRVERALDLLNLSALRRRRIASLSGGERQKLALATALVMEPGVLALDEPTSQLDPQAAEDFFANLERLQKRLGLTIVIAEQRLERVVHFIDQVIYLEEDHRARVGPPGEVLAQAALQPPIAALGKARGWHPLPLTVEQARKFATPAALEEIERQYFPAAPAPNGNQPHVLQSQDIGVRYGEKIALQDANLSVKAGELLAVMGANGAGKTSLLRALVGLAKDRQGRVWLHGQEISRMDAAQRCQKIGYLPQDPNALLFAETVGEELRVTLKNHALPVEEEQLNDLLRILGLQGLEQSYPRDLSAGQRQRVALAAILVTQPDILLLDEPTRGMDYGVKRHLAELLNELRRQGKAIVLATHDVELAAQLADRIAVIEAGRVVAVEAPRRIYARYPALAPQAYQLLKYSARQDGERCDG